MAAYNSEQIQQFVNEQEEVRRELDRFFSSLMLELGPSLTVTRAKEYLFQGVCRRLNILKRCFENIFSTFPVTRTNLLEQDERNDLEINLHSFVINVYGVLDNLAWVYVLEKSLEDVIKGKRKGIGLFLEETQQRLPASIRSHLQSDTLITWYNQYAKNYRDALAHRIPLYVPPSTRNKADEKQYEDLEHQIQEQIARRDLVRVEELMKQQDEIGSICPLFAHSFSDPDASAPIYLHPQVIVDVRTIASIGFVFCRHFHDDV